MPTYMKERSMETSHLDDYVRGWIVGGFEPTLFSTTDVEVAIQ